MKRTITITVGLVLSIVAAALMSSESRVGAQNQVKVVGDTGLVTLGPNQMLRVVATPGDVDGADFLVFRRIGYAQNNCSGDVCKYNAVTQGNSAPITLQPAESGFIDIWFDDSAAIRVMVLSNSRKFKMTASIVDIASGRTISQIVVAQTDGDIR